MATSARLEGVRLVVAVAALAAVAVPASAFGHAYVMTPSSRDVGVANLDDRAHKSGPCGNNTRLKPTQYEAGAPVLVKWQETIDHQGCFQIAFSPAADKDWVILKQINDPAGTPDNFIWQDTVTLPTTPCKSCTLVVRQLMIGQACTPNQNDLDASTYYSCADICIGDDCGDGGAQPTVDGGGVDAGGPVTNPTDGGGKMVGDDEDEGSGGLGRTGLRSGAGDEGCSVAFGATSGVSFAAFAGVLGLALARRLRQRQRRTRR